MDLPPKNEQTVMKLFNFSFILSVENARLVALNSDFDTVAINITAVEAAGVVQQSEFTFKVRKGTELIL